MVGILRKSNRAGTVNKYLRIVQKRIVTITEEQSWPNHGKLVDTENGGNGYHGRCKNCALPLVTDLGYCSWTDTKCYVPYKEEVEIEYVYYWMTKPENATVLPIDELRLEHLHKVRIGWTDNYFIDEKSKYSNEIT